MTTSAHNRAEGRWFALGGIAIALTITWTVRGFIPDAAWFNVRYADHLVRGFGFSWNEGGSPVEGFSSPVLLLVVTLLHLVGLDGLTGVRVLGVIAEVATIALVWRRGRTLFGPFAAGVGAFLVGATPALALWSVSGLETLPLTLVVTTLLLDAAHEDGGSPRRAGLLLAVLPWFRPEGALIAALLAVYVVAAAPNRTTRVSPVVAPLVVSTVALFGLRFALFGHLVPTSILFRFGSDEPAETVRDVLERLAPLLPFVVFAVARAPRRAGAVVGVIVASTLLSLASMDHLSDFGRHLLPFWPAACLLAGGGVASVAGAAPGSQGAFASCIAAVVLGSAVLMTPHTAAKTVAAFAEEYRTCKQEVRQRAADDLREEMAPGEVYAVADAGLISARAGGQSLDLFGLNDPDFYENAGLSFRNRAPGVLAREPNWLVLRSNAAAGRLEPRYSIEIEAAKEDAFEKGYMHVRTITAPDCDYYLWVFWRP